MPMRTPLWTWMVTLFSCGMLSWIAPLVIAARKPNKATWSAFGGFLAANLVLFVGVGVDSDPFGALFGLLWLATFTGSIVYSVIMGREPYTMAVPVPVHASPQPWMAPPAHPNAHAVAQIEAQRRLRHDARALATRDPLMARDLRIGRPDLPRTFDDGGLVDINSAPAPVLAQFLGLSDAEANAVIQARSHVARFERVDDLVVLVGMEPGRVSSLAERVILM